MSSDFDRILGGVLIEEIIQLYVPLKKTGKTLSACCPFHNEKTASFHVYPDDRTYHCFGCKANGDAVDFLHNLLGLPPFEALKMVASMAGLPPPEEFKKNDKAALREEALVQLWNACHTASNDLGKRLDNIGWRIREYDAASLDAKRRELGPIFHDVEHCGLAQLQQDGPLASMVFPPLARAWVLCGHKLGADTPSGFVVFEETAEGRLRVSHRTTTEEGTASLISNRINYETRLQEKPVFLTEDPLRALQFNRKMTALCPTAPAWRLQDVRNAKSSFPSATFILDGKHLSDLSLLHWVEMMGVRAIELQYLPAAGGEPVPALSRYVEELAEDNKLAPAETYLRAEALLKALTPSAETKMMIGRALKAAGIPVEVRAEVPKYEPPSPRVIRQTRQTKDQEKLHVNSAACHLLEISLLHLPYVDPALWKQIPPAEFGPHAAMASAITAFLEDPGTRHLDVASMHAGFWSFIRHLAPDVAVPSAVADFWKARLADNPTYWQKLPSKTSYPGKCQVEETSQGLQFFLRKLEKDRLMALAMTAQIDHEAEEQLRASYGASAAS